ADISRGGEDRRPRDSSYAQLRERHALRTPRRLQPADVAVQGVAGDVLGLLNSKFAYTVRGHGNERRFRVRTIPLAGRAARTTGARRARDDRPACLRYPAAAGEPPRPVGDQGRVDVGGVARDRGRGEQHSGPRLRVAQGAGFGRRRRTLPGHGRWAWIPF